MKGKFEEAYFEGYYRKNVGKFEMADLKKSVNWFWGWFTYLQKYVDFRRGKRRKVLEIGCSIGGASFILEERGFDVYASDISNLAIRKARKLMKRLDKKIQFYNFDVTKGIPIESKFDIILAFEVIEHLKDPRKAIIIMKSKLKQGGILICSTPNGDKDISSDPTHINVKRKNEWKTLFSSIGFKSITISQVSFLPFFYNFSRYFHMVVPIPIYSKLINSPLFIIARK